MRYSNNPPMVGFLEICSFSRWIHISSPWKSILSRFSNLYLSYFVNFTIQDFVKIIDISWQNQQDFVISEKKTWILKSWKFQISKSVKYVGLFPIISKAWDISHRSRVRPREPFSHGQPIFSLITLDLTVILGFERRI